MAASDYSSQGAPSQPLLWVIIPLLAVFSTGCLTAFVRSRHRRARWHTAGRQRILAAPGTATGSRCHVLGPGTGGARSVEGLNELGEAPPPYDAKGAALTDVEATRPPPGYCHVQPPPVVRVALRSERRSV